MVATVCICRLWHRRNHCCGLLARAWAAPRSLRSPQSHSSLFDDFRLRLRVTRVSDAPYLASLRGFRRPRNRWKRHGAIGVFARGLHLVYGRRGLALAIMMAGGAIGSILLPPMTQAFIQTSGWRSAFAVLGAMVLMLGLPVVAVFIRERGRWTAVPLRCRRVPPSAMDFAPGHSG